MRWLLVDDDPQMADLVRILLRRGGHTLVAAGDAATATRQLADGPIDLVLLDVNLPGVSGLEWLRGTTARPPVALFVQSGLAADIAAGWDAGAEYVVAKELVADPSGWRSRVDEVISHRNERGGFGSLRSAPTGSLAEWWNPVLDRTLSRVPVVQLVSLLRRASGSSVDAARGRLDFRTSGPASRPAGDLLIEHAGCMLGGDTAQSLLVALDQP